MGIVLWWDEDEEGKEEPDDFEPNWDELYEVMDSNVDAMIEAVKWNRDEETETE
jgi:hypothetical protein